MSGIPADRAVAEYLAQAAAAASGLLPAQRDEFLDRLHDEVRERVRAGPREDLVAVTSALLELGDPAELVAREQERLARGGDVKVREGRRLHQAVPWPGRSPAPAEVDAGALLEAPAVRDVPEPDGRDVDGLSAAVVRQRSSDLPTEVYPRPLFRDTQPEPVAPPEVVAGPSTREKLRAMRWELGTLVVFVVGPQFVGLLGLLLGGAMVARSNFWDVRDKVRALLGIPLAGALLILLRAWAESTQLNELETSSTRLRAAGESLADSLGVAVPVLGLLIGVWLGRRVARESHWGETARRAGGSCG